MQENSIVDFRLGSKYASAARPVIAIILKQDWLDSISNWEYSPYEYLGVHVLLFWRVDSKCVFEKKFEWHLNISWQLQRACLAYWRYFMYFSYFPSFKIGTFSLRLNKVFCRDIFVYFQMAAQGSYIQVKHYFWGVFRT